MSCDNCMYWHAITKTCDYKGYCLPEELEDEMDIKNAIKTMTAVFEEMDKDFTVYEYSEEIKALLKAGIFVEHIRNHFKDEHPDWKVCCKICNKSIDEITNKENK